MVSGLVTRVDQLTSEVGAVKQFEGNTTQVMTDLKNLASALGKLENLDKLGSVVEELRKVSGLLNGLFDAEGGSQGKPENSQESGGGGNAYVA